jgi:hypothetical protein
MRRIRGCSLLAFRGRWHVLSVPQPVGSEHDGIMGCRPASRRRPGRRDAGGGRPCRSHAARRPAGFAMALCAVLLSWCAPPVVHAEPEDAHRSPGFLYGSASRASRLHRHAGPAALVSASWPAHLARTFTDPRLCAAIVDRLAFAGQIIETGTTPYRLAHAR